MTNLLRIVGDVVVSYGFVNIPYSGDTAEELYDKWEIIEDDKPNKEEFLAKVEKRKNHYLLEEIRKKRNELLLQSDWTQSRDVMLFNDKEWKDYRHQLRDMPKNVDVLNPIYPYKPNSNHDKFKEEFEERQTQGQPMGDLHKQYKIFFEEREKEQLPKLSPPECSKAFTKFLIERKILTDFQ